jgi:RimJ/RimL family protein N-acetyltransferase
MRLVQYDIILEKLKKEDIELVRNWRNNPKIQDKMEFREYISSDMQKEWFNKINNSNHYMYMLVYYKNKKIGLTNRNISNGNTESGLFIGDDQYWNSLVPILIFLIASEVHFRLEGGENIYGKILKTNKNAISFNKSLGFKLCDGQDENENQLYCLKKEDYLKTYVKLKKYITSYYNYSEPIKIIFEKEDYDQGVFDYFNEKFSNNILENDNFIIIMN